MDHERKRQIRLVVALSAAVLLAVGLIYTSFSASSEAKEPSELLAAGPSPESIQLTGEVVSYERGEGGLEFEITDSGGSAKQTVVPVSYEGIVPDPFRDGREVIVTGTLAESGTFVAEKDSLITKCPSKFAAEVDDTTNVEFVD